MDDIGLLEGEAKGFILGGQGDGMAVRREDQLGMALGIVPRVQAILQHHPGQAVARQAGRGRCPPTVTSP